MITIHSEEGRMYVNGFYGENISNNWWYNRKNQGITTAIISIFLIFQPGHSWHF